MNTTTLQDFWATRPLRRRREGKVAGVCAGLGARYNVDPTLIRIAFVVATLFGGSGILLYIVAALVMPSRPGTSMADASLSTGKLIALGIVAVILVTSFGRDATWNSGGLLGAALMLVGCWLLYQRTPVPPPDTAVSQSGALAEPPPPSGAPVPGSASLPYPMTAPAPTTEPVAPAAGQADTTPAATDDRVDPLLQRPVPPSWDPLGVADFAWDLPNPPPVPVAEKPKPPRSAVLPVTAGVAVLTAMAGTAAQLMGVEWFTVGRIASLALLVIGVGLLFAGVRRKTEGAHARGLVPLGVLVGAIAVVATLVASTGWSVPQGGIGERAYEISDQSQLNNRYELSMGSTVLDLRSLESLDADRTVTIDQGVGQIQVLLPKSVRVRPECRVTIGDYTCPPGIVGGNADEPVLTIDARVGMGNVEMKK